MKLQFELPNEPIEPGTGGAVYAEFYARGLEPPPKMAVSEWADAHRMLTSKGASEPGQYRTARTPYLREFMDCLSPASPVRSVVWMKAAQIGATEASNNVIGFHMDKAPTAILYVAPTLELAKRYSIQKLDPMIEDSPALNERVRDPRSRDSGNSRLVKEFPGGILVMTGANSAAGLRQTSARLLILDDVDAFEGEIGDAGDPVALARRALRTFGASAKELLISTPTVEGRSRVANEYEASDQRRYFVPCPLCGHEQVLVWRNVEFERGKHGEVLADTVRYRCESCAQAFDESHKTSMLDAGRWIAAQPELSDSTRGYHLSALYSPLGWRSWAQIAQAFVNAGGAERPDPAKLRVWVNEDLAETWKDKTEAPKWEALFRRRESYPIGRVPRAAVAITCGVDVQQDRLELEVVGWAKGFESWSIEYAVLLGDPAKEDVWAELEQFLGRTWKHEAGLQLKLTATCVDAGYATQHVYAFCRRVLGRPIYPTVGRNLHNLLLGHPKPVDIRDTKGRKVQYRGVKLWTIGSDVAKSDLYGYLRHEPPLDAGAGYPPGFAHFPEYPEEYFKQLTAERKVMRRDKRGFSHAEWEKTRERNEALDCRVGARAAAAIAGLDRWSDERWAAERAKLDTSAPAPVAPRPRRRPSGGSGYWSRFR